MQELEAQFGTDGDAGAPDVAIQSHHTVSCD